MKTKFYLGALCLPLAFAACTNEEFESQITPSLENRGSIDVVLTAEKPAVGADTRMSIDENNKFLWEAGKDMIGAAMVDGGNTTPGTIIDEVYVNYPFVADVDGQTSTFTGKSSMTKGHYFFYYYYQDVLGREDLSLDMPVQEYDPASEKTAIQQASNYMKMISPIVNLSKGVEYEKVSEYNLNLKFANLYTMVKVNISSENIPAGITPSVTKVTLNGKSSGNDFVNEATAKFTSGGIGDITALTLKNDGTLDADKQAAALEELEGMIADGSIYDNVTRGASVLNVKEGCTLSAEGETTLYILAPKGSYNELTLTVETSEGTYERKVTPTTAAEPFVFNDNVQPIAADLDFAQDGTGNVTLPEDFTIASAEDWKDAVDFMTAHAVGYLNKTVVFNLTKDIAIDNLPVFKLTINGKNETNTGTQDRVLTLNKDYTINENNAEQFTTTNVTLGVAEGATLTVTKNLAFKGIKNFGTLNITADVTKAITNLGIMNVNADVALSGGVTNGREKTTTVAEVSGTINIAKGKTATISSTKLDNIVGDVNIAAEAILKLVVADNINKSKIVNYGKLTDEANGSNGATGTIKNTGKIDNYGTLAIDVTNKDGDINGTVIVEANSISNNNNVISYGTIEVVDVTSFSAIDPSKMYKWDNGAVTATKVNNKGEYNKADGADIANIILNGGEWKFVNDASSASETSKTIDAPESTTTMFTLSGTTLVVEEAMSDIALIVDGTSAISAATTMNITSANLTVNDGASLTVNNHITINAQQNTNEQTATIDGSLTVKPGAAMYFESAAVGEDGKVYVEGESASADAAIFGTKADEFDNSGYVESKSATKQGGGDAGKVTQPTNAASGTFKGNANDDADVPTV